MSVTNKGPLISGGNPAEGTLQPRIENPNDHVQTKSRHWLPFVKWSGGALGADRGFSSTCGCASTAPDSRGERGRCKNRAGASAAYRSEDPVPGGFLCANPGLTPKPSDRAQPVDELMAAYPIPTSDPVVAAIIPARNEGESIAHVVRSLRHAGIPHVRVVNNGSTDDTAFIAREAGAEVLAEPRRGYGAACWRGLLGLPPAVDWILFCDADGSDDISRLPEFLQCARNYDFILGARQNSHEDPTGVSLAQRIGNVIATTCISLGWGHRYRDMGPF